MYYLTAVDVPRGLPQLLASCVHHQVMEETEISYSGFILQEGDSQISENLYNTQKKKIKVDLHVYVYLCDFGSIYSTAHFFGENLCLMGNVQKKILPQYTRYTEQVRDILDLRGDFRSQSRTTNIKPAKTWRVALTYGHYHTPLKYIHNRPYSHKLLTINNYVNCPLNFASCQFDSPADFWENPYASTVHWSAYIQLRGILLLQRFPRAMQYIATALVTNATEWFLYVTLAFRAPWLGSTEIQIIADNFSTIYRYARQLFSPRHPCRCISSVEVLHCIPWHEDTTCNR